MGPRSSPGCRSWQRQPAAAGPRHSLGTRGHPGASGCSPGSCWPLAPAQRQHRGTSSPVPNTEPAQPWSFLQKTVFLAPGIVGENQRHHPAQEEVNTPGHGQRPWHAQGRAPGARWDPHGGQPVPTMPGSWGGGWQEPALSIPGAGAAGGPGRQPGMCPGGTWPLPSAAGAATGTAFP